MEIDNFLTKFHFRIQLENENLTIEELHKNNFKLIHCNVPNNTIWEKSVRQNHRDSFKNSFAKFYCPIWGYKMMPQLPLFKHL